jgi:hypothetical protein
MTSLTVLLFITLFAWKTWAFPAQSNFISLNQTILGRVHAAAPLARPCFSTFEGQSVSALPAQCSAVTSQYTSGNYRTEHYSGFMHDQNEICASSADPTTSQCLLDPTQPTAQGLLNNTSCGQGSVSNYYVELSGASDVQAAFAFAKLTGASLSVKNSGHDYSSRSSLRGSLALWTRKLQKLEYHANFNPEGCYGSANQHAAITVGAGINFNEVYHFADQNNVTYVGGSSPTVGASGGFAMTGGHGLLSSQFGLGIDRVMEYKIVTPDGAFRTANACQNQDLYWALRGGGGGTFGVVIESTNKVEPAVSLIYSFIQMPSNATNTTQFTQLLVDNVIRWSQEGWGGPNGQTFLAMVNPFMDIEAARKSMAPIADFARSQGGTVLLESHPSFLSVYSKYVAPTGNGDVGTATLTTDRLIPNSILNSTTGQAAIMKTLNKFSAAGFSPTLFATTPAYYKYPLGSTSATPAWRDSTLLIAFETSWAWNSTLDEKKKVVKTFKGITEELETLAPSSGSYISEADPWTEDWQASWWGDNYNKLLQIKKKYDPKNLLSCWRCVGWEKELQEPGKAFDCMGGLDV